MPPNALAGASANHADQTRLGVRIAGRQSAWACTAYRVLCIRLWKYASWKSTPAFCVPPKASASRVLATYWSTAAWLYCLLRPLSF